MDNKKNIIIAVALVLVVAIVAILVGNHFSKKELFKKLTYEMVALYPHANSIRAIDDSYLIFEWNPNLTNLDKTLDDTVKGIKFVNKELGFSYALYEKIANTTSMMGMRTESNEKFIVSWSYSSTNGLKVIYEKK